MAADRHTPRDSPAWMNELNPALAGCVREGGRLARTPAGERDLAWQVKAFYLGDLGALASAALRTPAGRP